jgi:hypothetical protein
MTDKPDIAERIGRTINELDIDFSQFSFVGWIVSLISLSVGGGAAYCVSNFMVRRNGLDVAAGLVFCFTITGVTTVALLALRWIVRLGGLSVTKTRGREERVADCDSRIPRA